jgi:hypothetical protein
MGEKIQEEWVDPQVPQISMTLDKLAFRLKNKIYTPEGSH